MEFDRVLAFRVYVCCCYRTALPTLLRRPSRCLDIASLPANGSKVDSHGWCDLLLDCLGLGSLNSHTRPVGGPLGESPPGMVSGWPRDVNFRDLEAMGHISFSVNTRRARHSRSDLLSGVVLSAADNPSYPSSHPGSITMTNRLST